MQIFDLGAKRKDGEKQIVWLELLGAQVSELCSSPEGFNYADLFQGLV